MVTARLRYSGLGFGLLVLAGLLLAWFYVSHALFVVLAVATAILTMMAVAGWNIFRQTSEVELASRGIFADDRTLPVFDPGLKRELGASLFAGGFGRRASGSRNGPRSAPRTTQPLSRSRPTAATAVSAPAAARPAPSATKPAPGRRAGTAGKPKPPRSRPARQRTETLQPEATVTLAGERQAAGVDDVMASLDRELVGLVPVKKRVEEIASLLLVDRARQRFGLSAARPNLHMCFTGAPGTGKTTVALMMADLLHRLGYLERGQLVHAMRDDLVGEYIGQTAPKTKYVLGRAMGGVLFIDEAYSLYRAEDSRDYGQECVDILMQVMENQREALVVILAGYKDRMDVFFESNPGMRSRVAHHLDFAAYQAHELLSIGKLILDRSSYYLSDDAVEVFHDFLTYERAQPNFANARSVRNALETARLRHAHRLAAEPDRPWTKDDLMRLEPLDIMLGND
jgi:probable Rubsico expression protein CbbX